VACQILLNSRTPLNPNRSLRENGVTNTSQLLITPNLKGGSCKGTNSIRITNTPNLHTLRIATWNTNGKWDCSRVEAFKTMHERNVDILAVQETRTNLPEKTSRYSVHQTSASNKNSAKYWSSG